MNYRKTPGETAFAVVNTFLLCLFGPVCIYPIIYIVAVSFSGSLAIMEGRVRLWPVDFHLKAYEIVFSNDTVLRSYLNTILYTLVGTAFSLIAITCAAYPLSKRRLRGRSGFSLFFVFTILFRIGAGSAVRVPLP